MDHLYKETAKELGIPEKLVRECVRHMFKNVRKVVTSGTLRDVRLDTFGTFKCKRNRLKYLVAKFWCLIDREELTETLLVKYNNIVLALYNKLNWKTYGRRRENRSIPAEGLGKIQRYTGNKHE